MYTKKQKTILIVGAGFLQSFIIKKAKSLGYYTITVDGCNNAMGFQFADEHFVIDIKDKEKILKLSLEKQIDGIITGATDYGVISTSYVAKTLNLKGLNYDSALLVKNKFLTRKTLYENNVDSMTQFHLIDSLDNAINIKDAVSFPVIVKPIDSSGSRGVLKASNEEEFLLACEKAIGSSVTKMAFTEKFIDGKEYGVEAIVIEGKVFVLSVIKKIMTNHPYFAELMHIVPSGLDVEAKVRTVVKKAIKVLGFDSGAINMDLLINDKNEIFIIDIGARFGGNMISSHIVTNSLNYDYIGEHIKYYMKDPFQKPIIENIKPVVSRLITLKKGIVHSLPKINELEKKYNVKIYFNKTINSKINNYRTNVDGCGYILSFNPSLDDAIASVEKTLLEIEVMVKQ